MKPVLTRAIELDPAYGWAIVQRVATYRQMGRDEEAIIDLTRAIELDPALEWAIAERDLVCRSRAAVYGARLLLSGFSLIAAVVGMRALLPPADLREPQLAATVQSATFAVRGRPQGQVLSLASFQPLLADEAPSGYAHKRLATRTAARRHQDK